MATDSLVAMETAMARDGIHTNDRQLACARINSKEGQDYLVRHAMSTGHPMSCVSARACQPLSTRPQAAMACAANYAWVNRSSMTFLCRQARLASTPHDTLRDAS